MDPRFWLFLVCTTTVTCLVDAKIIIPKKRKDPPTGNGGAGAFVASFVDEIGQISSSVAAT